MAALVRMPTISGLLAKDVCAAPLVKNVDGTDNSRRVGAIIGGLEGLDQLVESFLSFSVTREGLNLSGLRHLCLGVRRWSLETRGLNLNRPGTVGNLGDRAV